MKEQKTTIKYMIYEQRWNAVKKRFYKSLELAKKRCQGLSEKYPDCRFFIEKMGWDENGNEFYVEESFIKWK